MKRLLSMNNHYGAKEPFQDLFDEVIVLNNNSVVDCQFTKDDVLLLGGGEDISPSLYNHKPSRHTHARIELSQRDRVEQYAFNKAKEAGAGILGICRGAQLICAMSGGSLYQHVNNHSGDHQMTTHEGTVLRVSSVHHQMMNPFTTKHELIGWATDILSNVHIVQGEKNAEVEVEPEIVFFNDTRGLAIQFHPEFMSFKDEAVQYSRELVTKYFLGA
jgi:gamma-glutamyl-gamma-aminobutyrate hydrolase PuuD